MISSYLVDILILLLAAVVTVPIFQVMRLGAVPGFLIAGVIVGPQGFGWINNITEIGHLAEIGVVLLLFVIGIQLKPSRLWQMRRLVFGLGSLQILITGCLLSLLIVFVFDIPVRAAILIGPALALSSTAFVLQLLSEQKSLTKSYGRASISILLMQDLAVVPLLALVPLLAVTELSIGKDIGLALLESILVLVLVVLVGRYFLHPILHRIALSKTPEIFTASAVLIVLGTALVTEHIGLSMAMGAFLAGLLIADSSYRHQVVSEIYPFRGLLLGLFFMSMGMSLNLNLLIESPLSSIGLLGLLLLIKFCVLFPLVYWFGFKRKKSAAISLLLAQSGEFAMVLFSLAYQSEILSEVLFQKLLLIVLLSMLATPFLAQLAYRLVRSKKVPQQKEAMPLDTPVVLAGFGRFGHRIGEILSLAGKTFVALDIDPAIVEKGKHSGYPVFYGDVRKPDILKAVGVSDARIMIVTLDDPEAIEEVVISLRDIYPNIAIYARGRSLTQCQKLKKLGATGVVSENIEASLELAKMALVDIGIEQAKRESILADFSAKYHAQIDNIVTLEKDKI